MFHHAPFSTLAFLATVCAYTWPSPQLDELESARFDQKGLHANAFSGFLGSCDSFIFGPNTGRSNAADWIRMARFSETSLRIMTWRHNSKDGTGGLDASIRFAEEQARAENAGNGFANTMIVVGTQVSRYISNADAIALAAVMAIENCGGPEVAFRGGRIDATEPNAPGVPEPEQDLDSHIAAFARQGFTKTEMISLVACGHTFGGVQHDPFPDIVNVLNDTADTEDVAHFDSTFATFDNNVATEYISGTTQNPLVVGFNDTTNSDKRIFGSDGNTTMLSFANSPALFASTCADLFARMIDTVPNGVVLTDVITPLPVKPSDVVLTMNGDVLELSASVRLWNTTDTTSSVTMLWKDHIGGTGNDTLAFWDLSSATGGKYSAAWYRVATVTNAVLTDFVSLDPAAGITSMSFLVDGQLDDQNGLGFAIQDGFMLSKTSCQIEFLSARFDVAVRNGVNATRVYLEQITTDTLQRVVVVEIDIPPPSQPVAINSAYSLWSVNVTNPNVGYAIGAEIDGIKYSTTIAYGVTAFPSCSA
ncbi:Peroxidase [Mycena sanguinolenta]|uniref:Peroxidase n=1 Tax=Mycena sanguinolenta TaxID=230812 RepID=A0A8H7CVC0_9AGAR|nr:Peroxidase [Mycena sanguinolenta]